MMKEQKCKLEENKKENKNVEFAKEIFNNEKQKKENQKDKQC